MTTRQELRKRTRELMRIGQAVRANGLASVPRRSELTGLAVLMRRALDDPADRHAASRAAGIMHTAFEAALKASAPRLPLACGKGCA